MRRPKWRAINHGSEFTTRVHPVQTIFQALPKAHAENRLPNVETKPPVSSLGTLLVRANEGRTLFRGAHSVVILLDGKQTGEKFTTLLVISHRAAARGDRRWSRTAIRSAH